MVDGVQVIRVKQYENSDSEASIAAREAMFELHEQGEIKIVHNRFVLSVAWDAPYVYHCILTTPMGSLTLYLQSVGRVMRSHPDYSQKVLADHGGVIDKLGLPNDDREWELDNTELTIRKEEKKRRETTKGADAEPIQCGKCHNWRTHGSACPHCGHMSKMSVRTVIQEDGQLVKVKGRVVKFKPKKTCVDIYRGKLFAARNSTKGLTVGQVIRWAKEDCHQRGIQWEPEKFKGSLSLPPYSRSKELATDVYRWLNR
jgi:superfamily II DNA or RNA helicase